MQKEETPMIQDEKQKVAQQDALHIAQRLLLSLPGFQQIRAKSTSSILLLSVSFPSLIRDHSATFAEIEEQTGWRVQIHPRSLEETLRNTAVRLLKDAGLHEYIHLRYNLKRTIVCVCGTQTQSAACVQHVQKGFEQATGWTLLWIDDYVEAKARRKAERSTETQEQMLSLLEHIFPENALIQETLFHPEHRIISVHYSGCITMMRRVSLLRVFSNQARGWGLDLFQINNPGQKDASNNGSEALNTHDQRDIDKWEKLSGKTLFPIPQHLYAIPIRHLNLPRRLSLALECYHIALVGELLELSEEDLEFLQQQMENGMKEICRCLHILGALPSSPGSEER